MARNDQNRTWGWCSEFHAAYSDIYITLVGHVCRPLPILGRFLSLSCDTAGLGLGASTSGFALLPLRLEASIGLRLRVSEALSLKPATELQAP